MFVYFFSGQSLFREVKVRGTDNVQRQIYENFFCYFRVLYLVSVLKLTHPLLLTRFFKIFLRYIHFVVIRFI